MKKTLKILTPEEGVVGHKRPVLVLESFTIMIVAYKNFGDFLVLM